MANTTNNSNQRKSKDRKKIDGIHAILGMDIVAFSTLNDEDQIKAVEVLIEWIKAALAYHSVGEEDYCWSPAGDGGYLTFDSQKACSKAIDIAFSIYEKVQFSGFQPQTGNRLCLRMALHSGAVKEGSEIGRESNIWGAGINETARIVPICSPFQLLVSKSYFDAYVKGKRENEFSISKPYHRTVKHGVDLEVMNFNRNNLCINNELAVSALVS